MAARTCWGEELEPCGGDPVTGFYRDGCCNTGPEDVGSHTICAVVTEEFLAISGESVTTCSPPCPASASPASSPRRWCVTAANWLRAAGRAAASSVSPRCASAPLEIVPLEALQEHAVDVPPTPRIRQLTLASAAPEWAPA